MTTIIKLDLKQENYVSDLKKDLEKISKTMELRIDHKNIDEVEGQLTELLLLLPLCSKIMESATIVHGFCKGLAAEAAMKDKEILSLKQVPQKLFFEGMLSKWDGLYVRCETVCKDLRNQIEGYRSILSAEKEHLKGKIYESQRT